MIQVKLSVDAQKDGIVQMVIIRALSVHQDNFWMRLQELHVVIALQESILPILAMQYVWIVLRVTIRTAEDLQLAQNAKKELIKINGEKLAVLIA